MLPVRALDADLQLTAGAEPLAQRHVARRVLDGCGLAVQLRDMHTQDLADVEGDEVQAEPGGAGPQIGRCGWGLGPRLLPES